MSRRRARKHPRPLPREHKRVRYRVQNWSAYDRALVARGQVTLWVDERVLREWQAPRRAGQRGAPQRYSETLMLSLWALKARYRLTNRGVEGLMQSLLSLLGIGRPVPDHTTISRRGRQLRVDLTRARRSAPIHVLLDSTGIKIQGASTWRSWQHYRPGGPHTFRKLHLAADADTQEIVAVEVTDRQDHDKEMVEPLLAQIADPLGRVTADGNYDFDRVREAIWARGALDIIPPRVTAVRVRANPRPERDRAVQRMAETGSKAAWKAEVGYHRRSLIETTMSRLKGQFGERMGSRERRRQITELRVWGWVLNHLTLLGMPMSHPATPT